MVPFFLYSVTRKKGGLFSSLSIEETLLNTSINSYGKTLRCNKATQTIKPPGIFIFSAHFSKSKMTENKRITEGEPPPNLVGESAEAVVGKVWESCSAKKDTGKHFRGEHPQ